MITIGIVFGIPLFIVTLVSAILAWVYGAKMKEGKITEADKSPEQTKSAGIALISFGVGIFVLSAIMLLIVWFKKCESSD